VVVSFFSNFGRHNQCVKCLLDAIGADSRSVTSSTIRRSDRPSMLQRRSGAATDVALERAAESCHLVPVQQLGDELSRSSIGLHSFQGILRSLQQAQ
jgi:hypothetical protein